MRDTLCNRKMQYSRDTKAEREFLVDYVGLHGENMQEHLEHVVDYLHDNLPFVNVLRHARNLPNLNGTPKKYSPAKELVARLTATELPVVKAYLLVIAAHLTDGTKFDAVKKAAGELSFSKPIPAKVIAPKGTFSKKLIEAYEIV